MRILRLGVSGPDVEKWQHFLVGQGYNVGEVDGSFGGKTDAATKQFQRDRGLDPDGVVGRDTLSLAISMGYGDLADEDESEASQNWPPKPSFGPIWDKSVFGQLAFKAAPQPGNPEAIVITNNWAKDNIVQVEIPQLKGVHGAPTSCKIAFHKAGAEQLKAMWKAWEEAGLLPLVLGYAGSWVPRFIRGSRSVLSNHAYGTAFDINVPWNMLGTQPALVGQKGSVRKLVPIANDHGFYWGGHFPGRPDGMHFEVAVLK